MVLFGIPKMDNVLIRALGSLPIRVLESRVEGSAFWDPKNGYHPFGSMIYTLGVFESRIGGSAFWILPGL